MSQLETRELIMRMSDDQLEEYVRDHLKFLLHQKYKGLTDHLRHIDGLSDEHLRLDMSGYGTDEDNSCYFRNLNILKGFRNFGIWDFVSYLYLDAYKGTVTLYWKWWNNPELDVDNYELEFTGDTTTEIITEIIKKLSIEPRRKGWITRRFV